MWKWTLVYSNFTGNLLKAIGFEGNRKMLKMAGDRELTKRIGHCSKMCQLFSITLPVNGLTRFYSCQFTLKGRIESVKTEPKSNEVNEEIRGEWWSSVSANKEMKKLSTNPTEVVCVRV